MSAADVLHKAATRVLAHLGENAVLRGAVACKVHIERDVQIQRDIGDNKFYESAVAAVVDVAGIDASLMPRSRDALTVTATVGGVSTTASYVLDAPLKNNGRIARFVLLPA